MNSSGIKRGLATAAVSALAVAGLPLLASSASATPIEDTFVDPDAVTLYAPDTGAVTTKNDGTNTTVSLVSGGGANVASVLYQYQSVSGGVTWTDIPGGLVARNADGVFAFDWATPPVDLSAVRAVANTAEVSTQTPVVLSNTATTAAVELGTEGALGVFLSPYDDADGPDNVGGNADDEPQGDYIIGSGTTSGASTGVTVSDASHSTGATASTTAVDADGTGAGTTGAFAAILDITGYPAATGGDPNQIALRAVTTGAVTNTDDAEGSTLYNQVITTVTATPETQNSPGANGDVTIKVTDQNGKPVANAQVGTYRPDGSDGNTDPDDPGTVVGYTDAWGELVVSQPAANGTVTYYANTTSADLYNAGTDPADTATVTSYTPVVTSVVITSRGDRTSFDLDELLDGDEFTITTRDQNGTAYNEDGDAASNNATSDSEVEYRWVIDPDAAGAPTLTQDWQIDATDNGTNFTVPGLADADLASEFNNPDGSNAAAGDLPAGKYTLEARRPNVGLAGGLVNATPATYTMGESEITWAEGDDVRAPITEDITLDGTLALVNAGPGLAGRAVPIVITANGAAGDSKLAPQSEQPAGVTRTGDFTATVITDANGKFAVKLDDSAVPANVTPVPESDIVTAGPATESAADAGATGSLRGTDRASDNGPADTATSDATDAVTVNWAPAPAVGRIAITTDVLDDYSINNNNQAAPGSPVEMDVTVYAKDNDTNPANDVELEDQAVEITVDKGFLSPHAENAAQLDLADGHDSAGDQWGFFENLGQTQTLETSDEAGSEGTTGIVAAMEEDEGFDDDGRATMTITVKSGDVTETRTVEFDVRNFLALQNGELTPAAGEPSGNVPITEEVDFQLYVEDQFGNLVGDHLADVSDDSTVADVRTDGDFGDTETDFEIDGPGITAFSPAETTQTLTARMADQEVTVTADKTAPSATGRTLSVESDPITWVEGTPVKVDPNLVLQGRNNGARDDRLKANADSVAEGAAVTLYRKTKAGAWRQVDAGFLNAKGNKKFQVNDRNGKRKSAYKAVVRPTDDTRRGVDRKRVR